VVQRDRAGGEEPGNSENGHGFRNGHQTNPASQVTQSCFSAGRLEFTL
jgi:hypothetical protein